VGAPPPRSVLRRYLLRKNALRKASQRIRRLLRHGARSPVGDLQGLFPAPPGTVFDVGANAGYVTNDFHKAWPSARIVAFEPTPQTFEDLQRNVGDLPGVELVRTAVCDTDGTVQLRVDQATHLGGSNSLLPHSAEFSLTAPHASYTSVDVPAITLDTFCEERGIDHVDLLKIDVEGAEPLVLAGAGKLLARGDIDVILSEVRLVRSYEGQLLLHELTTLLAEHGFRPYTIYPFSESAIGQGRWGDAIFLSAPFRTRLVAHRGAQACGFYD